LVMLRSHRFGAYDVEELEEWERDALPLLE
jgi:hypothetical protein